MLNEPVRVRLYRRNRGGHVLISESGPYAGRVARFWLP
jgi:hypothetical protein